MNQLDILLPFALPPAEMATDLLRECKTPALAMLLARARQSHAHMFDAYARTLPHEAWLTQQFLGAESCQTDTSPPLASAAMRQFGLQADAGTWFILNPVHIHIARDHLVLTDPRQLALTHTEATALFEAAKPIFEDAGKTLVYGNAHTWFVQADDWSALQTASPDAACGHNIDIWMPKGEAELSWRKLQNEVQMEWHMHAVNDEREGRGAKPANSLWLWAAAPARQAIAPARYQETFNLQGWMLAFGQTGGKPLHADRAADVLAAKPDGALVVLDALLPPALASDWGQWLQRLHQLEADWFVPLLAALQARQLSRLKLVLTHSSRLCEFAVGSRSLHKFWVKPALARLLP